MLRTAVLLDGYVREQFLTQRDLSAWSNDDTDPSPDITGVVSRLLEARGLHRVALLFREGSYNEPSDSTGDQNFAFGLDRIVLGLEAGASRGR
ncbi:hypothetical protein AUC47_00300 [Microbacterium sp. SZ1]|nr:hypothetical protein AUC47_00300 [Microbacterium sp. SZ1]